MTDRIDRAADAVGNLDHAVELLREFSPTPQALVGHQLAFAQVQATLALVEQQRIANLLTALTTYERWPSRDLGKSFDDVQANVAAQVRDALGLS